VDAIWDLVWKGVLTNDTLHALRAFTRPPDRRSRKPPRARAFRSRRVAPPTAEGRWSLLAERVAAPPTDTEWSTATAQQLLARYGVLTREVAAAEGITGGFGAVYDVLKALEDAGRVRRGYFVGGVGATQFALPAALELLRSLRDLPESPEVVVAAATDPANPYGTTLKWPAFAKATAGHASAKATAGQASAEKDGDGDAGRAPTRTVGALVIMVNGALAAYVPRGGRQVTAWLPEDEPVRSTVGRALAAALLNLARDRGLLVGEINGRDPADHPLTPFLVEAGFHPSAMGLQALRPDGPGRLRRA
jgi:ATP-dependent Lhr-like helicase